MFSKPGSASAGNAKGKPCVSAPEVVRQMVAFLFAGASELQKLLEPAIKFILHRSTTNRVVQDRSEEEVEA